VRTPGARLVAKAAMIAMMAICGAVGCVGPDGEERAREAAKDIQASIQDFDGPALNQVVDRKVVIEVQTNLAALHEYKGEINGEIDGVLVNAIQAFQRSKNEGIPWWRSWQRSPIDGLITDQLRGEIAAAAAS